MKKHELSNESPTVPGHIPLLYTAIGVGDKNRDYVQGKTKSNGNPKDKQKSKTKPQ